MSSCRQTIRTSDFGPSRVAGLPIVRELPLLTPFESKEVARADLLSIDPATAVLGAMALMPEVRWALKGRMEAAHLEGRRPAASTFGKSEHAARVVHRKRKGPWTRTARSHERDREEHEPEE